ncbi:Non-motile and phage-resistance protein [compost metagenome]
MLPLEQPFSSQDEENAQLRAQLAALQQQAAWMEARYRTLMGATSQITWLAALDGRLIESPGWCRFTGLSPEAIQDRGWLQAIHPDDFAMAADAWARAVAEDDHYVAEYRVRRHDGVYRWFTARGRLVRDALGVAREWIGASRDIEEEKRAAEALRYRTLRVEAEVVQRTRALRKSEEMLAEAQRLAHIGSWELDVTTRELTWSEEQCRLFGLDPTIRQIPRAQAIARIDPRDLPRHEEVVQGAIARAEAFSMEYRAIHPDGRVIDLHSIGRPVLDDEGRVVKLVGTSQDVTERSQLTAQLRAQYEQLMALDQLKNNFVNSVTHELRTPLTSIVGYAEFLEDELGGPVTPEQREFIHQIQRGARRLEYLLNDLLDFARLEAGTFALKIEPAELGDRVREVVESLRPQADASRTSLVACMAERPLDLEMDSQRIGQVLTNLISNAIKFTPAGGTIRVMACRQDTTIRCEIQDSGPGILAEDRPRLFQRFSQLEAGVRMGKGTGLGLSISKALVEAHGGTIGVTSTPGVGSTFWFELPIKQS